ncbi:MAG TPA: DUF3617 family protein [Steroidobacteraceae bacterium]
MPRIMLSAILCCAGLGGVSQAGDVPDVKPGLWKTTTTTGDPNVPAQSGTMCTSTALLQTLFDQRLKDPARPCKQTSVVHSGTTITEQTECKFDGTVKRNKVVTVVSGDTEVRTEIHEEGKNTVTVSDSKWLSACPAGMQLGDFVGADGMKFNILHPENARAPAKAP